MSTKPLFLAMLVLLLLGIAFAPSQWFMDIPKGYRYLIPEGYSGWLCLSHVGSAAPSLKIEDGFHVVQFDDKGLIETSDKGLPGKSQNEYFFYSKSGTRPLNIESEMGIGFGVEDKQNFNGPTYIFWVSKNAKLEQPPYTAGSATPKCGHQ